MMVFILLGGAFVWFLLANDHGEKEPIAALWMAIGLGVLGTVLAGLIESKVLPVEIDPLRGTSGVPMNTLFVTAMMVGAIEELAKFLPLAIWIYKKRYFNEYTDGVIYFALAGLGFGLPENILYTMQFGASAGLARLFLTPLFHSAMTALVGYFLIRNKLNGKPFWAIVPYLFGAIVLHGLYDFGLLSQNVILAISSVILTLAATIGLFVMFVRANQLDKKLGKSVVGHNRFCRNCGFPNPDHSLYCTNCGKIA